jgi:hypothetical protein
VHLLYDLNEKMRVCSTIEMKNRFLNTLLSDLTANDTFVGI